MISTSKRFVTLLIVPILICIQSCSSEKKSSSRPIANQATNSDVFDAFMASEPPPADGFYFPVGDENGRGRYTDKATGQEFEGWYVATQFAEEYSLGIHTGEDWLRGNAS